MDNREQVQKHEHGEDDPDQGHAQSRISHVEHK